MSVWRILPAPRRGGTAPLPRAPSAKAAKEAKTANAPRKGGARGTVLLQRREDQVEHDAADEDDRHAHGRDVADHDAEINAHPLLLQADLVRDEVLVDEVSGEDAGADRHDGHEDAVGEVVEHIQDAVGSAGRELEMDAVEHAEAERGEHAEHEDEPEHDEAGEPRRTATIASTSEMDEVSAAKKTRMKNAAPIQRPPGRLLNTAGSCTNMSEGPDVPSAFCAASDEAEKAKMDGMMMVAATMANAESQMAICSEDLGTLTSFFIYEP